MTPLCHTEMVGNRHPVTGQNIPDEWRSWQFIKLKTFNAHWITETLIPFFHFCSSDWPEY